ncbi:MAG: SDR family NAD(P)-dependent oxidoreductase, partial [Candidatus Eremiobacterota bacterium]
RAALERMGARRRGHIVFVSSLSGRRGLARMSAYASSKGALHILSQVLRLEAAAVGVHVSEVLPISVRTGFFDAAENRSARPYRPSGLVLTPERVAESIVACLRRPRAEVYPSLWSRLAPILDALFPDLTARLLSWHERRGGAAPAQERPAPG